MPYLHQWPFTSSSSEIGAGKLLVDPGHLQEELVGGHYRRPVGDRALQKNTHINIADDHAKK